MGAPCAGAEGAGTLSTDEPMWFSTAGRGVGRQLTPSTREQFRSLRNLPDVKVLINTGSTRGIGEKFCSAQDTA